ncbi:MAG: hypothetical protein JRI68_24100 [Deltaproteobacteria bacterium]|nr:hypothetical protein [Deltaproteobacteria bacterium]
MRRRIRVFLSVLFLVLAVPSISSAQSVLWDSTHGTYSNYDIAGDYSDLATRLTNNGYTVSETSAGLNNVNLSNVDVIVVAVTNAWNSAYTQVEINSIQSFVNGGGGLLILCDEVGLANANLQGVASLFGVTCGLDNVSTDVTTWNNHAVSAGMGTLYVAFAGALALSSPAISVGYIGSRILVAAADYGSGHVVIVGDLNWAIDSNFGSANNHLFCDNTFAWLSAGGGGPQCGNGTLDSGEVCDDGNNVNCDGCRADCSAYETGCGDTFVCAGEVCDDGNTSDCDGCRGNCSGFETGCGDGYICGNEVCDDGNAIDCDGCRGNCSATETGCGDTFICGAEVCDDGNTIDCDGCAGNCSATDAGCGDGILCGAEVCDDGNTLPCDGCSADCGLIETGCGDGFMCGTELCDDGNTVECDGCSAICTHETGCGDTIVCGEEECDDGNNADGDGCSGNCKNEGTGGSGGGTTSSGTGGTTSSGTGGATSSGTSSGSSSDDDEPYDPPGPCDCRAPGQSPPGRGGALALLGMVALTLRRRRQRG